MRFGDNTKTFRELIGNGVRYRVPMFQRDYRWNTTEWEELWFDIEETLASDDENPQHYMGYLVLRETGVDPDTREQSFDVVDGQQRMTTLSLIVLGALQALSEMSPDDEGIEKSQDVLRSRYVGNVDAVYFTSTPKLTLNRNNDEIYRRYLTTGRSAPAKKVLSTSNWRLVSALRFFKTKLLERFSGDTAALIRFVDAFAASLVFTRIVVRDELDAFKVFETLNARGVRLSPTDLLKNHLFSVVFRATEDSNSIHMNELESQWHSIADRLGAAEFPDFMRTYWNSRHRFVRKTNLFREIRQTITEPRAVYELVHALDRTVDTFAAMLSPDDEFWTRDQLSSLLALRDFGVTQPRVLILAAYERLSPVDLTRLLEHIVTITVRFNVVGRQAPGEQEKVYARTARMVVDSDSPTLPTILDGLRPVYIPDNPFRHDFETLALRTTATPVHKPT